MGMPPPAMSVEPGSRLIPVRGSHRMAESAGRSRPAPAEGNRL